MTVHMIRLFVDSSVDNVENVIDNWVQNHNTWDGESVSQPLTNAPVGANGDGEYLLGSYRFTQDSTATDLLDDIEIQLSALQGEVWYRIGYHQCPHDEANPQDCSWEQTRENGTVPDSIPSLS